MLVNFCSMTFALIYFVGQLTFQSEEAFPDKKAKIMRSAWLPNSVPQETVDAGGALWHVVPGFVDGKRPVTIVRTTHPSFLESMRLFGVPDGHPSRLEGHAGCGTVGATQQWIVLPHTKSVMGIVRYKIMDAANPDRRLTVGADGAATVKLGEAPNAGLWYIVPAPPYGWDLVAANTGKRLEVQQDGRLLTVPQLTGSTHFDIMRLGRTRSTHRSHFWPPPFFAQALSQTPRRPVSVPGMEAVVGTQIPQAGQLSTNLSEKDCVKQCADNTGCTAVWFDNERNCVTFNGGTPDPSADRDTLYPPMDALSASQSDVYPHSVIERERRLFGDPTSRMSTAVPERTGTWNIPFGRNTAVTMYTRKPDPTNLTAAYRECLLTLGANAPECQTILEKTTNADARFQMSKDALGQWDGKVVQGICGPLGPASNEEALRSASRLWSAPCRDFCRTAKAREDGMCRAGLKAHCAAQTEGGLNDPMCACYLSDTTFAAIRAKADENLGTNSPLALQISNMIRDQGIPQYCWYNPCRSNDNRPPDITCPAGDVYACVQVSKDNTFSSGGGTSHQQVCGFPGANVPNGGSVPAGTVQPGAATLPSGSTGTVQPGPPSGSTGTVEPGLPSGSTGTVEPGLPSGSTDTVQADAAELEDMMAGAPPPSQTQPSNFPVMEVTIAVVVVIIIGVVLFAPR